MLLTVENSVIEKENNFKKLVPFDDEEDRENEVEEAPYRVLKPEQVAI